MSLKLKAIEPPCFYGDLNQVDNWFYSLELYFAVCELDYTGVDQRRCCALACALLRGNALQWHKRLHRSSQAPIDYPALKVVMCK